MSKKIIIYSVFIIAFLTLLSISVFAQEVDQLLETTSDEAEVLAEELEVEEPGIFSWFWNTIRDVQILVTRDPIKKSELQLKKASRQLIKARKMISENPDDVNLKDKLERISEKYQSLISRINDRVETFEQENPDASKLKSFLDKYTNQQFRHQEILRRLEEKVPAEVAEQIRANRERYLEKFGEVMNRLQTKTEFKERISELLKEGKEGIERRIRRMEIVDKLEQGAGAIIREGIREIKQERKEIFQELKVKRQEINEAYQQIRQRTSGIIEEEQGIENEQGDINQEREGILERIRERIREFRGVDENEASESGNETNINESGVCIQVITLAKNSRTEECREFSTPCSVPAGWETVAECD